MKPMFSIIVPCFNAAKTLPDTIAAIQAQSFADWEAIFVDDGSTDRTPAIVARAAQADRRISLIRQKNAGPSVARNTGAQAARAPWLAFLDADDIWLPGKLASVAETIAAPDWVDAVFGQVSFMRDPAEQDISVSSVPNGPVRPEMLAGENPVCTLSNLTVSRPAFAALGGFSTELVHSEDLEFLVRLVTAGYTLAPVAERHLRYRASEGGLSSDLSAMHEGWRLAVASLPPRLVARGEAIHLRYLARRALRLGLAPRVARDLALRGMALDPFAFFSNPYRGGATLAAALVAPLLPRGLCLRAFAH